jgi:hypothetical protein
LIPSASSCQPKQLWNYCQGQGEQLQLPVCRQAPLPR